MTDDVIAVKSAMMQHEIDKLNNLMYQVYRWTAPVVPSPDRFPELYEELKRIDKVAYEKELLDDKRD